jgi:hypothetical protein
MGPNGRGEFGAVTKTSSELGTGTEGGSGTVEGTETSCSQCTDPESLLACRRRGMVWDRGTLT